MLIEISGRLILYSSTKAIFRRSAFLYNFLSSTLKSLIQYGNSLWKYSRNFMKALELVTQGQQIWQDKILNVITGTCKSQVNKITCSKSIIKNTRKRCEICSKLTVKTPLQRHWRCSGVFIVKLEHISNLFLSFLLQILNKQIFVGKLFGFQPTHL